MILLEEVLCEGAVGQAFADGEKTSIPAPVMPAISSMNTPAVMATLRCAAYLSYLLISIVSEQTRQ